MEVKKYNPFVVKPKPKTKTKIKTKLEAKGLSQENKKKIDIIYARGFFKTCKKQFRAMGLRPCFTITMSMGLRPCFTIILTMTTKNLGTTSK